jgi:hypothetical protein
VGLFSTARTAVHQLTLPDPRRPSDGTESRTYALRPRSRSTFDLLARQQQVHLVSKIAPIVAT